MRCVAVSLLLILALSWDAAADALSLSSESVLSLTPYQARRYLKRMRDKVAATDGFQRKLLARCAYSAQVVKCKEVQTKVLFCDMLQQEDKKVYAFFCVPDGQNVAQQGHGNISASSGALVQGHLNTSLRAVAKNASVETLQQELSRMKKAIAGQAKFKERVTGLCKNATGAAVMTKTQNDQGCEERQTHQLFCQVLNQEKEELHRLYCKGSALPSEAVPSAANSSSPNVVPQLTSSLPPPAMTQAIAVASKPRRLQGKQLVERSVGKTLNRSSADIPAGQQQPSQSQVLTPQPGEEPHPMQNATVVQRVVDKRESLASVKASIMRSSIFKNESQELSHTLGCQKVVRQQACGTFVQEAMFCLAFADMHSSFIKLSGAEAETRRCLTIGSRLPLDRLRRLPIFAHKWGSTPQQWQ